MKSKELKAERESLVSKCEALQTAAKATDRDLTEQEFTIVEDSVARVKEIDGEIQAIESRQSTLDALGDLSKVSNEPAPRKVNAQTSGVITDVKAGFEEDPKRGFKTHKEFLKCVMSAEMGGASDSRLNFMAAAGSDEHSGGNNPYGGYLVPKGFLPEVLTTGVEADPTIGRTRSVPLDAPHVEIPARVDKNHSTSVSGGLTVSRSAETISKSSSRMELEKVAMKANSLFGVAYATRELLTDSPSTFISLIQSGFGDEMSSEIFDEKINGTGVGEYEGVLNTPSLITIAKETNQAASTIVFENIVKMYARCWGKNNAIWVANHDTLPTLAQMNQTVGTAGIPAWQTSAREGEPNRLMGLPVFFSEYAKSVGTKGDIMLCNWNEYLEGTLQPLQSEESMHVRFLNHENAFKFFTRNDGRAWWKTAMTPKNGSTLSPFVTLAARA